jgi:arylsulfatase
LVLLPAATTVQIVLPRPHSPLRGKIAPTAPPGAPHIVLILLDDAGFGAASAFGGPAVTLERDKLAVSGSRYNDLIITATCSPTRASLLTGRHRRNFAVNGYATAAPAEPPGGSPHGYHRKPGAPPS